MTIAAEKVVPFARFLAPLILTTDGETRAAFLLARTGLRIGEARAGPKRTAKAAGQFSRRIAVDVYGHWVPGGNRPAVDRLDDGVRNS